MLESKTGKVAAVIGYGRGVSPAILLQEIKKDGTPAPRKPYWSTGTAWHRKGWCKIHIRQCKDSAFYRFSEFVLFETTPPHNPDRQCFRYVVTTRSDFPDRENEYADVAVMAASGKDAASMVASDPLAYGIRRLTWVLGARPAGVREQHLPLTPKRTVSPEERRAAAAEANKIPKGCLIMGAISLAIFAAVLLSLWWK